MAGEPAEGRTVCHWYDDGHSGRYLIPGCAGRAQDPDDGEACTCPTIEQQLEAARRQVAAAGRSLRGLQGWHDAIVRAVQDHPDGVAIMKAAADLADRGYGRGRPGRRPAPADRHFPRNSEELTP